MTPSRYVVHTDEVAGTVRAGTCLIERTLIAKDFGPTGLIETVLSCGVGTTPLIETGDGEDLLFVISGSGKVLIGDETIEFGPESGLYIDSDVSYRISVAGPERVELVSVRVINPEIAPDASVATRCIISRLSDMQLGNATAGRHFRILANPSTGFRSGTHFVGYVPAGEPAPMHYHRYDEVLYILEGEGILEIDGETNPLRPGTCYQLPAGTLHQVVNTGSSPLSEVAVFLPAGSPAAAYYPDGKPCQTEPLS